MRTNGAAASAHWLRWMVAGLAVAVVVLSAALVAVLRDDGADVLAGRGVEGGDTAIPAAGEDRPSFDDVTYFPCQTSNVGPASVQLVEAGAAVTEDYVLLVARTAAPPALTSDKNLEDGDWAVYAVMSLWEEVDGEFAELYTFNIGGLAFGGLLPSGRHQGGPLDPAAMILGRDKEASVLYALVERDELSVLEGMSEVGVTVEGVSQVFVNNNDLSQPDFYVGLQEQPSQWCPDRDRVEVYSLEGFAAVADDAPATRRPSPPNVRPSATALAETSPSSPPVPQATDQQAGAQASDLPAINCPASPTDRISGEQAAQCLYNAYKAGDRRLAGVYADEGAVAALFQDPWTPPEWEFEGCSQLPDASAASCNYFIPVDPHGVLVEMWLGGGPSVGNYVEEINFLG